ncbi:MAG: DUF1186 domain-containing protein [Planctomycetia bacterium]|nr:DUF1186 domain-containing protein [Planctomycetia bacterium]
MESYNPPVAGLLKLGYPNTESALDYTAFGIRSEHIPDLIRMLGDKELLADEPEWYAHIHAWRALGQLHATQAIEPLLDLVAENATANDWSDWIGEEVPEALAEIGPEALVFASRRLNEQPQHGLVSDAYARVLQEVATKHPDQRAEAIAQLCRILETATNNTREANAFVIGYLADLKATEAWPAIEAAYATNNVDETICGELDDVKYDLGLGPEPPSRRFSPMADFRPAPWGTSRGNAKQRFNERQRKKKQERKQNKKKRKGK